MPQPLTPASLAPFWTAFRHGVALSSRRERPYFGHHLVPKIGLCISGGPDSMALAYLIKGLLQLSPEPADRDRLSALIVDHNARPGSRQEAETVAGWLKKLGITSTILPMEWEEDHPGLIPNFESEARERRYRHLAAFAREQHIQHLFTGHHHDDQMETLLLRLTRGSNPSLLSLRGMAPDGAVPECDDLRGVRNVEPSVPLQTVLRSSYLDQHTKAPTYLEALRENRLGQVLSTLSNRIRGLSHGGISLHRPLLPFTKDSLLATCEAHSIPYITDKTNNDPGFTKRNAIRLLRTRHTLPRAIQDHSLLGLVKTARNFHESVSSRALLFLRLVSILTFDFRSGTAEVLIPRALTSLCEVDPNAAAYVLSKISSIVCPISPDEQATMAPLGFILDMKTAMGSQFWQDDTADKRPILTYNHVMFEALPTPQPVAEDSTLWRLMRQPMNDGERKKSVLKFDTKLTRRDEYSRWSLWDHRYWVRVEPQDPKMLCHLQLRAYNRDDARDVYRNMSKENVDELRQIMRQAAFGKIRYSLPVLTLNNRVIAFPTLFKEMVVPNVFREEAVKLGFSKDTRLVWDVAYKLLPKDVSIWGTRALSPALGRNSSRRLSWERSGWSFDTVMTEIDALQQRQESIDPRRTKSARRR